MPTPIPLIRAGCLVPHLRWMEARDRPTTELLGAAGIPGDPRSEPERPIPLMAAFAFLREAARREAAPDLGWRVVGDASLADLGVLGKVVVAHASPGRALMRASAAMAHFCSHERLDFVETRGYGTVRVSFQVRTDPEALHQAHLLTLGLIGALCAAVRPPGAPFERVEITPHPLAGLRHVPKAIAPEIVAAPDGVMLLRIGDDVLQRRLPQSWRAAAALAPVQAWGRLRGASDFLITVRTLIEAMLDDGQPSAERLAVAVGVSLRTLQRRLATRGTTFTALVDDARRERALDGIAAGQAPISEIAGILGYGAPSALTRAVRRWAGRPPRDLRRDPP